MTPNALSKVAEINADEFRADFPSWLLANSAIYFEFERQAKLIASRRDYYSARTIIEVMRHNSALSDRDGNFRLNNNRTPDLARLFSILHPEHAGFFQLRESDGRMDSRLVLAA